MKLGVYFTPPSATTSTSPPVNIEVTAGPIVAVFLFLVLLLLILLILVALKEVTDKTQLGLHLLRLSCTGKKGIVYIKVHNF